jgi:hypothetical protein
MRNICLGAVALIVTACSSTSAQQPKRQASGDVVAIVGSTAITLSEIDDKAMQQPVSSFGSMRLSQAIYEARRVALDDAIANKLIDDAAKAQRLDRAALIEKEITWKIATVSDADIQTWYQANQQRVQGATLDQVRAPIQSLLTQQRTQAAREAYIETLKAKTPTRVMIQPPRVMVTAGNSPVKGSASAPIELIEFADFECPACRRHPPRSGCSTPMATASGSFTGTSRCRTIPMPDRPPKPLNAPTNRASSGRSTIACLRSPASCRTRS